jgi:hypothetical protein
MDKPNSSFRKIAIKTGDNDFYSSMIGVLGILKDAIEWRGSRGYPRDKKVLAIIIRALLKACYMSHQNVGGVEYESNNINEYLDDLIREDKIFLDSEVDDFLRDHSGTIDADFFVLDLDLDYEGNEPIYII